MRPQMGVNLPSGSLRLPALTEKDKKDLDFGLAMDLDYVALSFVRRAEEVQELRELCERREVRRPSSRRLRRPERWSASTRSFALPTARWWRAAIWAWSYRPRRCPLSRSKSSAPVAFTGSR